MNAPGFWEIGFLAFLALIIFGPEKLPEMARKTGQMIGKFKAEASSTIDELKRAAEYEEFRSVAGELKSTSADVHKTLAAGGAAVTGGVKDGAATAKGALASSGRGAGPVPFDPDAT